jgi:hypothetical protein
MRQLFILLLLLLATASANAFENITVISGGYCKPGVHNQPYGSFAIYVFCDHALGTNVSLLLHDVEETANKNWSVAERFWQSEEWGTDVTAYLWLPDKKHLVISTSKILGKGAVYKLDLENKIVKTLYRAQGNICSTELEQYEKDQLMVMLTGCNLSVNHVKLDLTAD